MGRAIQVRLHFRGDGQACAARDPAVDRRGSSRFLDALQLMYSTAQEVGESVYGPKFKSGNFLVRKHLYGAASKDCDHWHDDAGIVTHHLAYTLEAEQSLQAIHPGVSIPYWDYTIDAYFYNTTTVNGGGCGIGCWGDDWTSSKIFNDDWFGLSNATTTTS